VCVCGVYGKREVRIHIRGFWKLYYGDVLLDWRSARLSVRTATSGLRCIRLCLIYRHDISHKRIKSVVDRHSGGRTGGGSGDGQTGYDDRRQ